MELRHLRYFIAVAEAGSLTVAAEKKLHTAQPSLSRHSHGSPPIRGLSYTFRKSPVAHDCVVVDAARIEPVFTLKFPASREFSREFFEKRASEGDSRI
jgi:Bacterial regulatory helix-turn-helix protein, lysR family